jgi:hypothetical protein
MRIGILGSGSMGGALGRRWAAAGHAVAFSYSRDPARLRALAHGCGPSCRAASVRAAAEFGDAVLLATPWPRVEDVLNEAAGALEGKTLIDCTNPLNTDHTELEIGHTGSGGETVAQLVPGARTVKAFNTVFARVLDGPWRPVEPATVPLCGDNDAAKAVVAGLAADAGLDAVDAGPLRQARGTEALALLEIAVWQAREQMLSVRLTAIPAEVPVHA